MAIDVIFYQFNKNDNSTKRPTAEGRTIPCNLIDPTSIIAPSIALALAENPTAYNYAKIPAFNRYYFVTDWTYNGGRWVASLDVDVLATYKDEIGASTQYVLRSSKEYDGTVQDTLYPTVAGPNKVVTLNSAQLEGGTFVSSIKSGCYVVGIINNDENAVGCVSYYQFTNTQFRALCSALMQDPAWAFEGITEISQELFKSLFNPFQYIVSCMWFPFSGAAQGAAVESIPYGWWSLPVSAVRLANDPVAHREPVFRIPKHPQSARGSFLNSAPYTRHTLIWPVFGSFPLDANIMSNATNLRCDCWIDLISGKATVNIFCDNTGVVMTTTQTMVGVPIQLAQQSSDYIGAVSSAVGGGFDVAASAAMGNIGGAVNAAFNTIGNTVNSLMPQLRTAGSNGMISAYRFEPVLNSEFYKLVTENNEHRGRPLCSNRVISEIPGFIMVSDTELEIPGTAPELERVKAIMNGGFFYE